MGCPQILQGRLAAAAYRLNLCCAALYRESRLLVMACLLWVEVSPGSYVIGRRGLWILCGLVALGFLETRRNHSVNVTGLLYRMLSVFF